MACSTWSRYSVKAPSGSGCSLEPESIGLSQFACLDTGGFPCFLCQIAQALSSCMDSVFDVQPQILDLIGVWLGYFLTTTCVETVPVWLWLFVYLLRSFLQHLQPWFLWMLLNLIDLFSPGPAEKCPHSLTLPLPDFMVGIVFLLTSNIAHIGPESGVPGEEELVGTAQRWEWKHNDPDHKIFTLAVNFNREKLFNIYNTLWLKLKMHTIHRRHRNKKRVWERRREQQVQHSGTGGGGDDVDMDVKMAKANVAKCTLKNPKTWTRLVAACSDFTVHWWPSSNSSF